MTREPENASELVERLRGGIGGWWTCSSGTGAG